MILIAELVTDQIKCPFFWCFLNSSRFHHCKGHSPLLTPIGYVNANFVEGTLYNCTLNSASLAYDTILENWFTDVR